MALVPSCPATNKNRAKKRRVRSQPSSASLLAVGVIVIRAFRRSIAAAKPLCAAALAAAEKEGREGGSKALRLKTGALVDCRQSVDSSAGAGPGYARDVSHTRASSCSPTSTQQKIFSALFDASRHRGLRTGRDPMAPVEEPWSNPAERGSSPTVDNVLEQCLARRKSSGEDTLATAAGRDSGGLESPSRKRWGSVKTWMFGHMLASSFAKVSLLDHSSAKSLGRKTSACMNEAPAGQNDWDCCFERVMQSASSSTTTLCDDAEAEQLAMSSGSDELTRHVFDILKVIGSGSYGTVLLSSLRACPDRLFAIKVVHKHKLAQACGDRDTQRLLTEKQVLCSIDYPFITKLFCSFETNESLNFVMEYCPGGDMYFLLEKFAKNRLPESFVVFYAASIALALNYLHQRGIVYRDIKPENILLDKDGFIRLADFGFAKEQMKRAEQRCRTFCGSADYIAPEVVRGSGYGMAADLWSFGCVVYELLTGFPPFYCPQDRSLLFRKIERSEPAFPSHLSAEVQDLLSGLLHKDADKRLGNGPNGMNDVFAHPFFASVDWYLLSTKQMVPPLTPKISDPLDTSNFEDQFTSQHVGGHLAYEEYAPHCEPEQRQCQDQYFEDFDWCCSDAAEFH